MQTPHRRLRLESDVINFFMEKSKQKSIAKDSVNQTVKNVVAACTKPRFLWLRFESNLSRDQDRPKFY